MIHTLSANIPPKTIRPSTLRLGGDSPAGDRIGFTNYYMELNGAPYFAVCGEFHYTRYPRADWETELRKMKMSGVNIVATYIFWNHHEETEGEFDWRGDRDLRAFTELCGACGLYVILRIGPFCHGEVRNGGLPDWLFGREFEVRSNDAGYLAFTERLYREIGRQAAGLMFGDGGPVIGIQLENELNAAAALRELTAKQGDEYLSGGSGDGAEHMRRLKTMAADAGLIAPLYTSTGWGGSPVLEDEVLPLYGGYAYTPWSVSARSPRQKPTGEYVFVSYHDDEAASAFNPPYPRTRYPFACCEMGGGMQTWYLSRFRVEPESVAAMSLMKLAGGCNFIGYYMFHGGTNPVGRTGYLNESTTPRITYDFQAPIGEFGQIRASNHLLRPLHYFLKRFGGRLAPMATVLPGGAERIRPEDADTLRYAVRTDGRSGFLFINNYQDHVEMAEHRDVRFALATRDGELRFPQRAGMTIRRNASMMLPFHFDLDGLNLRWATAQPVTSLETPEAATFFFAMPEGVDGEFAFDGAGIARIEADAGTELLRDGAGDGWLAVVPHGRSAMLRLDRQDGRAVRLYAMAAGEAETLWEAEIGGRRRLLFADVPVVAMDGRIDLIGAGRGSFTLREYTGGAATGFGWTPAAAGHEVESRDEGWFRVHTVRYPAAPWRLDVERLRDAKISLRVDTAMPDHVDEVLLSVDYTGNVGYAFSGGQLLHDHFHNGAPWEIGLSRFRDRIRDGRLVLETTPLRKGEVTMADDAAMAAEMSFTGEQIAVIRGVAAEPIYRIGLHPEQ